MPQLPGQTGRAKSYAERLFEFVSIDRLDVPTATAALCVPAQKEQVKVADGAIKGILAHTHCYPYFLQEWGKQGWNVAGSTPISAADAKRASGLALAELDASFFRVRFDRLTPLEKRYPKYLQDIKNQITAVFVYPPQRTFALSAMGTL
ncbi:MAG: hypothetical protein ACREFO_15720 [Acetobacteraceae bacterium]